MSAVHQLIPLSIEARGEVIASNVSEFREMVREWLETIIRRPSTDEEFGEAELDVKRLKDAEAVVKTAKQKALADAEQVQALFVELDATTAEIAKARLELEKTIAVRKEEVKKELVEDALASFDIDPMDARRQFLGPLQDCLKGKRSLESMRAALRTWSTTRQAQILASREVLERFAKAHGTTLIMDRRALELRQAAELETELRRRFDLHQAEEARKQAADELAKARAETAAVRAEVVEAAKPPAPPTGDNPFLGLGTPPPHPPGPTEHEEWEAFERAFLAAFAPVKEARAALKSARNIARATVLSNSLITVWSNR